MKITERVTINPNEVKYFTSDVNYSKIHFNDGSVIVISYTLKLIENKVKFNKNFLRIHKSHIINKNYIEGIFTNDKETIVKLSENIELLVSRRKQKIIKKLLR